MGRSTTPKYVVKMVTPGVVSTPSAWHVKPPVGCTVGHGKPSDENLAKYIETYIASLKPGGVNYHLTTTFGTKVIPNSAVIAKNDGSGEVVAEWKAPAFMVI